MSNATLRFFTLAEQCHTHEILIWLKTENSPNNEDKLEYFHDLKNEDNLKNGDDLKNEDDLKKEDDLKNEDDLKKWRQL